MNFGIPLGEGKEGGWEKMEEFVADVNSGAFRFKGGVVLSVGPTEPKGGVPPDAEVVNGVEKSEPLAPPNTDVGALD